MCTHCRLCNVAILTDGSLALPVNAALAAMCNLANLVIVADRQEYGQPCVTCLTW